MQLRDMMSKSSACLALTLTTACGGGGDGFAPLTDTSGEVDAAQAALLLVEFEKAMATFKIDGAVQPPQVTGVSYSLTQEPADDPYDACRTEEPETPVDEDSDSIPKSRTIKFDCDFFDGHAQRVQKGEVTTEDFDDTKQWSAGGYEYTYDLTGESTYKDGGFYEYSNKGYFRYEVKGKSNVYDSNYASDLVGDSPSDGEYSTKYHSTWLHEVTPDDTADPGKTGTVEFSGFYFIKMTSGDPTFLPLDVTVKLDSTGVSYDRSCSVFYKEGSVDLIDAKGNKIRYEYACTSVTKLFNGNAI